MKDLQHAKINIKEIVLWAFIVCITILAFWANYYFNFSGPIKAIAWISWLILTSLFVFFTTIGKTVFEFAKESKIELQKVVWPTRQETIQTTSIVMVMVTITGFVLWGIDSGMMWIIGKLTHLG